MTFVLALLIHLFSVGSELREFRASVAIMHVTVPLAMRARLPRCTFRTVAYRWIGMLMGKDIPPQALQAVGGTLNVYSQIGLVMLIGLIHQADEHFDRRVANQSRDRGMEKMEAVIEARPRGSGRSYDEIAAPWCSAPVPLVT